MMQKITEEELREIVKDAAGTMWFSTDFGRSFVPGMLAEIETCPLRRLIEIAQQLGITITEN